MLAQLALVYWRPDFTPVQAKELYAQYLDDLRDLPFAEIVAAVKKYRRGSENKFYPTPGQLRGMIKAIPSWDVSSPNERARELLDAAKKEMGDKIQTLGHLPKPS